MFNKNALKGFAMGMLAAIIVALGVWPALAHDSDQLLLSAGYELASHAAGSPGGSPGAEELDRVAADEVTGQGFGGSSPLVIPAAAFRNDGDDPEDYFFYFWAGYVRGEDPASDPACMMAPAYLPDGACVTDVYAYLYDNDSSEYAYAELQRVKNRTGLQQTMASVSTSGYGNSTSIRYLGDTTINKPTVSDLYSYYVTTCLWSPNTRLWAVRIFYEEECKTYLPLVMKGYCGCGPDSYEPNSPCGNAEPLTLPASITSYISCCDVGFGKDGSHDIGYGYDYFSINIGTGGTVNIVLSNIPAGQDYGLYLYEKNCSKLKKSSQRPGNVNETISVSLSSGTYHILVYSGIYGQHSTSPYSLQVTGP